MRRILLVMGRWGGFWGDELCFMLHGKIWSTLSLKTASRITFNHGSYTELFTGPEPHLFGYIIQDTRMSN